MSALIKNDLEKCVGCNRCIRMCPIEDANIAYSEGEMIKVKVDSTKCITCGACVAACRHSSRYYEDDTERFFRDLQKGEPISLFCAPASRANLARWDQVLGLLRRMGVNCIFDVSLGADICTWAYIRYIQKYQPEAIISQPCPAIVDYVLMHAHNLLPYLAPVHSPMLCTAVYMRKYKGITDKIGAISPCIAKGNEFEQTNHMVTYNVTFKKLYEYIEKNNITLPGEGSGYDHMDSALGSIYSMPGGLKENVEFMLGKALRVDKSEGQSVVYKSLKAFGQEDKANLPHVFDVLNCPEGCNLGTGCEHHKSVFAINTAMENARQMAVTGRDHSYFKELYRKFDEKLNLEDFIRSYQPININRVAVTSQDVEHAFGLLDKHDELSRAFDCGACGSDTCVDMAHKIAKGVNTPQNCIQKAHGEVQEKHNSVVEWQRENADAILSIEHEMTSIKELSDDIINNVTNVGEVIKLYDSMSRDISKIAMHIHMISLNASIEAARAGEHGASFGVIAQAIRSLAGDTQEAINKITRASADAKDAIGGIAGMVVTIGDAISQSHNNISMISDSTKDVLDKS